jgi:hypothetical protein
MKKREKREAPARTPAVFVKRNPGALIGSGVLALFLGTVSLWSGMGVLPGLGAALILGAARLVKLNPPEGVSRWLGRLLWAFGPLLSLYMVETQNYNNLLTDLTPLEIGLNLIWYYMLAGLIYLILGRRNRSAQWSAGVCFAIGCINRYVIHFRGRSIFPVDLLTLRTAANVAGSYSYQPSVTQVEMLLLLVCYLVVVGWLPGQKKRKLPRWKITLPALGLSIAYVCVFAFTPLVDKLGIEPSLWTTRGNGFFLNFSVCLKYSHIEKPAGYSLEAVEDIVEDTEPTTGSVDVTPVNIIVIMDEALSDLSVNGDLTIDGEMFPYISSLTENTIKGHAWSSVFGGTTANSEYEFLTGNSMAFLPAGSVPYQLFVQPGEHSLVGQLKQLGYTATAMHPYKKSGWNRTLVYPRLGFETMLFLNDLEGVSYVRDYVSDASDFQQIIKLYEEKEEGEKFFLFNVTMQNHSAYNLAWTNLPESVTLSGSLAGTSNWANQYLSLVHETDQAFQILVDYFSQVEEPTIILLFGDHQPQLSNAFYEELMGKSLNDLTDEEGESRYETMFVLWANYDIPEAEDVNLSINYLSTLLLQQTNLPLSGYQTFLSGLMEELPVIHATGYWTADGQYASTADDLPEDLAKLVNQYAILQYNNIGDRGDTVEGFFPASGD